MPTPSDTYPSNTKTVSGGILNEKAVELPQPVYPPAARAAKASGMVIVQVTINEKGEVTSANAISGHPLLKASAVQAARGAKFPSGATKISGLLTYKFSPAE